MFNIICMINNWCINKSKNVLQIIIAALSVIVWQNTKHEIRHLIIQGSSKRITKKIMCKLADMIIEN